MKSSGISGRSNYFEVGSVTLAGRPESLVAAGGAVPNRNIGTRAFGKSATATDMNSASSLRGFDPTPIVEGVIKSCVHESHWKACTTGAAFQFLN